MAGVRTPAPPRAAYGAPVLSRRGTSLVETLVALVLAAIVLAAATGSLLRQQRTATTLATTAHGASQARASRAVLVASLALQSTAIEDLTYGESRDTSLQLRVVIASGLACDAGPQLAFSVTDRDDTTVGVAGVPRTGDTLWWFASDRWRWIGRPIADAWTDTLRCRATERDAGVPLVRMVQQLRLLSSDSIPFLAPLRVTRTQRFDVYRSGDGSWQFGLRDWSDVTHALSTPQPAAGPFQRIAADGARTGFRYFDSLGTELDPQADSSVRSRIARVRLTTIGAVRSPTALTTRDSVDVAIRPASPQ